MRFTTLLLLIRRQVFRRIGRYPLAAALNLVSVAIGVAVYVAVQIANHSATRSFEAGVELVAGRAELEVRAAHGTLDEMLYPLIAAHPVVEAATPLVQRTASLHGRTGEYLTITGIDLFTDEPFRSYVWSLQEDQPFDFGLWLARSGIGISERAASKLGIGLADNLDLIINGEIATLPVAALFDSEKGAGSRFALMDIGWAQEVLGMRGSLSAVLVKIRSGLGVEAAQAELQKGLPAGLLIERPSHRSEQVDKMMAGFRLNLQAMSGVSLLVGAFLIYGTILASVVRRRSEIGILRAMGLGNMEIRSLFLAEALTPGIPGIFLGLLLGVALGNGLLGAVAGSVSSLYVAVTIDRFYIPWVHMGLATCGGIAAILLGAWLPAREASRVDPVDALNVGRLRERSNQVSPWLMWLAVAAALLAWWSGDAAIRSGPPWLGFVSAFFVLLMGSAVVPMAMHLLALVVRSATHRLGSLLPLRLAASNLGRSLHRVSITAAGLVWAVGLSTGVAVMIHSFRESVSEWVQQTIVADLFIGLESNQTTEGADILPIGSEEKVLLLPGVASVETYRRVDVTLHGRLVNLAVVDGEDRGNIRFKYGGQRAFSKWLEGDRLIVSESAAQWFGLALGSEIMLPTPSGLRSFEVAGIFRDYTSDRGVLMIRRDRFREHWREDGVQSLAVYLEKAEDAETIADQLLALNLADGLRVYTNQSLRDRIFEIFEETFVVTRVLRLVAMTVAVFGVLLGLSILVVEKAREIALLRAQGADRSFLFGLVFWEAQLMAFVASVVGLVTGVCLALVLTWVVNRAFFGWSIDLALPLGQLLLTPIWVAVSAALAGLWPAWRAAEAPLTVALREE